AAEPRFGRGTPRVLDLAVGDVEAGDVLGARAHEHQRVVAAPAAVVEHAPADRVVGRLKLAVAGEAADAAPDQPAHQLVRAAAGVPEAALALDGLGHPA